MCSDPREQIVIAFLKEAEAVGERRDDSGRLTDRRKRYHRDKREFVHHCSRDLERQAGFTNAAGSSQGEEAYVIMAQEMADCHDFPATTDQ
jgi:hypothetical protein